MMIDNVGLEADFAANFNAPNTVPAAIASSGLWFFSTPTFDADPANFVSNGGTLDNDPLTWESLSVNSSIPAGTRWIVVQLGFQNASIGTMPAYVDDASLCIS